MGCSKPGTIKRSLTKYHAKQFKNRREATLVSFLFDNGGGAICVHPNVLAAFSHYVFVSDDFIDLPYSQSTDFTDAGFEGRQKRRDGADRVGIGCIYCLDGLGFLRVDE